MNHIRNLRATLMVMCSAAPCLERRQPLRPELWHRVHQRQHTFERNPILADNGDARTSKVVSSDVRIEQD